MGKGGKREGSGRKKIGTIVNIRIEENLLQAIEKTIKGKNKAEKIRLCLQKGLKELIVEERGND